MKLVVQRVKRAQVTLRSTQGKKRVVGSINKGYFVLVGVTHDDTEKEADYLAEKLAKLRVMSDEKQKMNLSLSDTGGEVLVVSQFTLYGDLSKGNRPSFIKAAKPEKGERLYNYFVEKLRSLGVEVKTGEFGAMMQIDAQLDGPVTILVSSK